MDAPMDSVINRAEVDWKSRLPALQRKVAMAVLESGDPRGAQEILLRKPIVLPDGTLKANLDFMDLPREINEVGNHEAVVEVDRDGYLRDDHPERISGGVLVSYQSQSYERLTDHLGDYEDDSEAHDAIYDELAYTYRRAITGAADSVLSNYRNWYPPRVPTQYADDLEILATTLNDEEPSLWDIADVIKHKTAFYTTEPGEIWVDAIVVDAGYFDRWADGVLGTDGDDWMMV